MSRKETEWKERKQNMLTMQKNRGRGTKKEDKTKRGRHFLTSSWGLETYKYGDANKNFKAVEAMRMA